MKSLRSVIINCVVLFICFGVFACENRSLKRDISKLIGSRIELNIDSMEVLNEWCDISLLDFSPGDYNLIVYYDSTTCNSCEIGKLNAWREIINRSMKSRNKFRIFYIFSPQHKDIQMIKRMLDYQQFDYLIFIDSNYVFCARNESIANNRQFHVFLIDKDYKIKLVGNPLNSRKLWELYESIIESL